MNGKIMQTALQKEYKRNIKSVNKLIEAVIAMYYKLKSVLQGVR